MKEIPLGNQDCDLDVCWDAELQEWIVVRVPIVGVLRQPLTLDWYYRTGEHAATVGDIYTGTADGGTFPRLAAAGAWNWLAHRAIVNERMQATLRKITGHTVTGPEASYVFGPADGQMAINGDWIAFQDTFARKIYGHRLTIPPGPAVVLREADPSVIGTGLSHLDGDHPVTVTENNSPAYAIAGMTNAVRRYGIVVGENPSGGIEVRTGQDEPQGTLLAAQYTNNPRPARNEHDEFAAVHWGHGGARIVLFTTADLEPVGGIL